MNLNPTKYNTLLIVADQSLNRSQCYQKIENICTQKTLRGTMEEIQHFLSKNQQGGVKFKVIHLLRDPRGKINSHLRWRKSKPGGDISNFLKEHNASNLCHRQLKDISIRKDLERLYPQVFKEVMYEDVASNPLDMAEEMYRFSFSESVPKSVKQWILKNTNSSDTKTKETDFNTARKNSTSTSLAWRKELNKQSLNIIERECKDLINYLKGDRKYITIYTVKSKLYVRY